MKHTTNDYIPIRHLLSELEVNKSRIYYTETSKFQIKKLEVKP